MHPLVAINLVFLAVLAWTITVLTLLIALAKSPPPARPEGEPRVRDEETRAGLIKIAYGLPSSSSPVSFGDCSSHERKVIAGRFVNTSTGECR